jgi:acyl-CoA thioester hydrolase
VSAAPVDDAGGERAARPLLIELPLPVKWADADMAGIVHNLVYIRWLEDLRTRLLELHLPLERMLADGYAPVIGHTEIDYRRPIPFPVVARGVMWSPECGARRWVTRAEFLLPDGSLAATAMQWGVFVDLKTMRPVALPASLRAAWQAAADARTT